MLLTISHSLPTTTSEQFYCSSKSKDKLFNGKRNIGEQIVYIASHKDSKEYENKSRWPEKWKKRGKEGNVLLKWNGEFQSDQRRKGKLFSLKFTNHSFPFKLIFNKNVLTFWLGGKLGEQVRNSWILFILDNSRYPVLRKNIG